jgi:prepilin-type N-terminal cleavage/methylation domain-containing protein
MRPRRGFTLIEILAALIIFVALAALIMPQVVSNVRRSTATAVESTLTHLVDGLARHKGDVRRFPAELRWLTDATAGTPTDICGTTIPAALLLRWGGPYLQQQVGTAGIPAGDATVLNALDRDPAAGLVSNLVITVVGVEQDIAARIEAEFDGNADFNGGTIRWVGGGGGAADTLRYYMPIRGC